MAYLNYQFTLLFKNINFFCHNIKKITLIYIYKNSNNHEKIQIIGNY